MHDGLTVSGDIRTVGVHTALGGSPDPDEANQLASRQKNGLTVVGQPAILETRIAVSFGVH